MKHIVVPNLRRTLHDRVGIQHATVAKLDVSANNGIWADLHTRSEPRLRRNYRLFVNLRRAHFLAVSIGATGISRSTILHISVASAASCPSTVALPSSLQKSPRHETTLISSFS